MLLGDEKLGVLCGNLEEAAHGYQTSTSAVRVLERTEGWMHTAVKMAPLKARRVLVTERGHGDISSKQVIQKTHTWMYNGVWCSEKSTDGSQESWAFF